MGEVRIPADFRQLLGEEVENQIECDWIAVAELQLVTASKQVKESLLGTLDRQTRRNLAKADLAIGRVVLILELLRGDPSSDMAALFAGRVRESIALCDSVARDQ